MVSYSKRAGRITVRLHKMFRHAGPQEARVLAGYISGRDKGSSSALDSFIALHAEEIRGREPEDGTPLDAVGKHHDLVASLERVSVRYFGAVEGMNEVAIGWGRARASRRRRNAKSRSRALATYSYGDRAIRVNPVLDSKRVPVYVLDWIVYHELLHHVLPVERGVHGKRRYHTKSFRGAGARLREVRGGQGVGDGEPGLVAEVSRERVLRGT